MFATALIVFRESLEAALLVGIMAAATRNLSGRHRWLSAGVGVGVLGAIALAVLAQRISGLFDGLGQDVINIAVLSVALAMLLWHCIWVSTHTREMVDAALRVGQSVRDGQRAPWALFVVVALAILREGAETVLFVSGSLSGAAGSPSAVLLAGGIGLAAGVSVGLAIFVGLARVPTRHVFSVTNVLVALLAGSIASQLIRALAQVGWLEAWTQPMWDSSSLLAQDSALGTLLHALIGYDARPSAAQLSSYLGVLLLIYAGSRMLSTRPRRDSGIGLRN